MIEIRIDAQKFIELSGIVCSEENIGHLVNALFESSRAGKDERIKWNFEHKDTVITLRKRPNFG